MSSEPLPPFAFGEFLYTEPPNPNFTSGQRVDATEHGRKWLQEFEDHGSKTVHVAEENPRYIYQLMKSGIVPRPIAFISTISEDGVENIGPFSFFNQVCSDPPLVSFCGSMDPRSKDTVINARTTKGYTINIISEAWAEQANMAAIDAPPNVSEWELSGLTKEPSVYVKAPRVKESAFSMEVEFFQAIDFLKPETEEVAGIMIIGTVKAIHVRNDLFTDCGIVNPAKLKPVARLGDISYSSIGPGYRMPLKVWGKDERFRRLKKKGCTIISINYPCL